MAFYQQTFGSYTSDGNARQIDLAWKPDLFKITIQGNASGDNFDSTANPGVTKLAWFYGDQASNTAFTIRNTNGAATDQCDFLTANGFRWQEDGNPYQYAALTISSITQASSAVVTTSSSHGYQSGDIVVINSATGMEQINTLAFQITVTGAATFTIPLDSSGFAAAASGGTLRKVDPYSMMFPSNLFVSSITQASQAVVTTTFDHGLTASSSQPAFVVMTVPAEFGMNELDGKLCKVVSASGNSLTLDVNTTGFTAFAWPTAAQALAQGFTPAQATPSGELGQTDNKAKNTTSMGMVLGSSVVGPNGALVFWEAYKGAEN
jgi:hypothetical protein